MKHKREREYLPSGVFGGGNMVKSIISLSVQKLSGNSSRRSSTCCPSNPQVVIICCNSASDSNEQGSVSGDCSPKLGFLPLTGSCMGRLRLAGLQIRSDHTIDFINSNNVCRSKTEVLVYPTVYLCIGLSEGVLRLSVSLSDTEDKSPAE